MSIGTRLFTWLHGELVGTDQFGNKYYLDKRTRGQKRERRWVIYDGAPDASKVPPEWHGWLHRIVVAPPTGGEPARRTWRSEESRVGKECVSKCRFRLWLYSEKQKLSKTIHSIQHKNTQTHPQ